jgi:hypothetical protein
MVGANPSDHDFLKMFRSHLLLTPVPSGRLYTRDGDEIGIFGEKPILVHTKFEGNNRRYLLPPNDGPYDVMIPIVTLVQDYILISELDLLSLIRK